MHDKGRGPDVEAARRIIALWDYHTGTNAGCSLLRRRPPFYKSRWLYSLAPWPLAVVQIKLPCPDRVQDCSVGLQLTYLGIFLVAKTHSTLTRDDSDGRRPPRRAEHLEECKLAYSVGLYIELGTPNSRRASRYLHTPLPLHTTYSLISRSLLDYSILYRPSSTTSRENPLQRRFHTAMTSSVAPSRTASSSAMSAKNAEDSKLDHPEACTERPLQDGPAPLQSGQHDHPCGICVLRLSLQRKATRLEAGMDPALTAAIDCSAMQPQPYDVPHTASGTTGPLPLPALTHEALQRHGLQRRGFGQWGVVQGLVCDGATACTDLEGPEQCLFHPNTRPASATSTHRTCNECSMQHSTSPMDHGGPARASDNLQGVALPVPQLNLQPLSGDTRLASNSLVGIGALHESQKVVEENVRVWEVVGDPNLVSAGCAEPAPGDKLAMRCGDGMVDPACERESGNTSR